MKPDIIQNAWAKSLSVLFADLNADQDKGLSDQEAGARINIYGPNTFGTNANHSTLIAFFKQFASPLILILLVAALVTLYSGDYIDALFILLAVGTSISLGFYQEYKAERATAALRSYIEERVRFWRDDHETEAEAKWTVPGDVVLLRAGERVPADGRVIETYDLSLDESVLTGESLPILKHVNELGEATPLPERSNMVFGGTYVAEGQGKILVTATGASTEFGRIAEAVLEQKNERTPLQKAVGSMGWTIAGVALLLIALVYMLGIARGMEQLDIFLVGVAIAVGAIPEALPPGLTAILAVGVERIAKRKGIVRSLLAAETLGSATVVITDKTGTLTTGKLDLVEVLDVEALLFDHPTTAARKKEVLGLAVTNTAAIILNPDQPCRSWQFSGRHLDVGILSAAIKAEIDVGRILNAAKPVKLFSSAHKYSVYEYFGQEVVLGAPDILLLYASLSDAEKDKVSLIIERHSYAGKRLLGVGLRRDSKKFTVDMVGLLLFYDPLRPDIKEAIAEIEASGCRVIMATGDLPGTAVSIAASLGWAEGEKHLLTSERLASMNDEELIDAFSRVRVFARMTPSDKYHLVEVLENQGEVVAMLGDGVNDAPSLKRASIGVAVGSGTDVAKGVADLVLLEDDFHTIKAAIDEGRLIVSNIRKTFVYLMSNCFDEMVLLGGSLLFGLTLPLSPLQVIWVNFLTGSIPAIAYAFDRQHSPRKKREPVILSYEVLALTFGIGILSSVALLVLYYCLVQAGLDSPVGRTFLFVCFSSYILFVAYSFRNLRQPLFSYPLFENHVLNAGVGFGLGLLLATIYLPFFQDLFNTVSLPPVWIGFVVLWIMGNVALVELAKWLIVFRDGHTTDR